MQIHPIGYRIKGFYHVANMGHRWDLNPHAQQRIDILRFWEVHGTTATGDAFAVSRRTLYRWRHTLTQASGDPVALTPQSRAPKRRRHAVFRREVVDEIRRLRKVYPNLGKLPLSVFINTWCQTHKCPIPSVSTIGRIIDREPDKMRHAPLRLDRRGRHKPLRQTRKTRRPKGISTAPMEVFACDTVERVRDGLRRYIFTFIDPCSRFAFAWASTTRSRAAHALRSLIALTPNTIQYLLSDNGSEFMKDFDSELKRHHITHWWDLSEVAENERPL